VAVSVGESSRNAEIIISATNEASENERNVDNKKDSEHQSFITFSRPAAHTTPLVVLLVATCGNVLCTAYYVIMDTFSGA
jgi:hypothetical protein